MDEVTDTAAEGGTERVPTGIAGLDEALAGGLIRGDIYLLAGEPGTGKTTLANQFAHNHARTGGVALFVTVMAEPHERMSAHLRGFEFFDRSLLADRVHYVSLYDFLRQDGLAATLTHLRQLVRRHSATLLVVDGADMFGRFASTELEYRQFTFDLHGQLAAFGCTSLLLTQHTSSSMEAIDTHVDGIVLLENAIADVRTVRLLEVRKLRGVNHLTGRHQFTISKVGIQVYPRLEETAGRTAPPEARERNRHPIGVSGLDDMLRGGLFSGTTTLLLGAPGAGKTTMGLHFVVEGARRGEPGLFASFHESPGRLIAKAASIGLELEEHVRVGRVRILWHPPAEASVDVWTRDVLSASESQGTRRIFVDAITDVERLMLFPERLPRYLGTLSNELRARDMLAILAAESRTVVGSVLEVPVSALVDNTLLLRYVELHSQLHRLMSVIKLGESDFDTSIREFQITGRGMEVATSFESAEAVLTGVSKATPPGSKKATSRRSGVSRAGA